MFKTTKIERKIKEINLLMDVQINLFVQNFRPLFLTVSPEIIMKLIRN